MRPIYDLAVNLPLRSAVAERLTDSLRRQTVDSDALGYPYPGGHPRVLDAIARWMIRHSGHPAIDVGRLTLTLGARHALSLALDATCAKGDALLVEELTYHGFRAAAQARGVQTIAVAMDDRGMRADDLERVARASGGRTVYLQPTLHNPTTVTMPLERRRDIAEVAHRLELTIIEGDVYGALAQHALPPLSQLAPDRCYHAGGIGKVLGPGLRIGWLLSPDADRRDRATRALADATDGLPSLLPGLVADWLDDGSADDLLASLRSALHARNALARSLLGNDLVTADGLHAWLPCVDAEGWAARALDAGVRTTLGRRAGGNEAAGLRLSLASEEDPRRLETALRILAELR